MIFVKPLNFTVMENTMMEMINNGYSYGYRGVSTFIKALFSPMSLPYTIILILLIVGLCITVWKAPRWVRPVGRYSMFVVALNMIFGIMQLCDCAQKLGGREYDWNNGFIGVGMKSVFAVAIVGVVIYIISLFISIAQKPRI